MDGCVDVRIVHASAMPSHPQVRLWRTHGATVRRPVGTERSGSRRERCGLSAALLRSLAAYMHMLCVPHLSCVRAVRAATWRLWGTFLMRTFPSETEVSGRNGSFRASRRRDAPRCNEAALVLPSLRSALPRLAEAAGPARLPVPASEAMDVHEAAGPRWKRDDEQEGSSPSDRELSRTSGL